MTGCASAIGVYAVTTPVERSAVDIVRSRRRRK